MTKLQFLCSNHRRWLRENPRAAVRVWMESYSRSFDLLEEHDFRQALLHAGSAFETAEIVLGQAATPDLLLIRRFADSSVLLAQVLYLEQKPDSARAVLAASVVRFERLLALGIEKKAVLAGCEQLMNVGESPSAMEWAFVRDTYTAEPSQQFH
ncbi:MAG: hypothetical protein AB8B48_19605 [Pseudomonadales bacterium]